MTNWPIGGLILLTGAGLKAVDEGDLPLGVMDDTDYTEQTSGVSPPSSKRLGTSA